MINVDKKEIYRYLGYRRNMPDAEVLRTVDSCLGELQREITPRYVYRQYPVESIFTMPGVQAYEAGACLQTEEGAGISPVRKKEPQIPLLRIAGMEIRSLSLSRNLRGCENVYLMAATLGLGPDRLIARASVTHMSRAVILQAAAAAMIESWCDEVNQRIIDEAASQGLYCRPRFSPGYGDFSLEYQKDMFQILQLPKSLGMTLTGSLMMVPTKSVTALAGISLQDSSCSLQGCEACGKRDCPFRREEA